MEVVVFRATIAVLSFYFFHTTAINVNATAFTSGATISTPANLLDVLAADLDGDADSDLITIHDTPTNLLTVRKNNGNGTFASGVNIPGLGADPFDAAVADLDRDGDQDIAVAVWNDNFVRILTNNGSGTFSNTSNVAVASVSGVTTGDFNRDGWLDLASTSYSGNAVLVSLGSSGGFGAFNAISGLVGSLMLDVISGDLDNDGDLDLASIELGGGRIQISVNNGSGSFTAGTILTTGPGANPNYLQIADLERDGKQDIIVVESGTATVGVWKNNGSLTFTANGSYSTSSSPRRVVLSDLNGDSISDLTVGAAGASGVKIFPGIGNGTFGSGINVVNGGTVSHGLAAADLDSDGDVDLISSNAGSTDLRVLTNISIHRSALMMNAITYPTGAGSPTGVATGDLNNDGNADLVIAKEGTNEVGVLLSFIGSATYATGVSPVAAELADMDSDGDKDLVTANYSATNNVSVLLNNSGTGTFASAVHYSASNLTRSAETGDIDRDGDLDVVALVEVSNEITVFKNNGSATLSNSGSYSFNAIGSDPRTLQLADFDRDGDLDAVSACALTNNVVVQVNNGSGVFSTPGTAYTVASSPYSVITGDLDRDGDIDLAVSSRGTNTASVLLNNGSGAFGSASFHVIGNESFGLDRADLDRDGDLDLVATNYGDGTATAVFNNGLATFSSPAAVPVGSLPRTISLGDFNGDGRVDGITANNGSANATALINLGGHFALATVDTSPSSVPNGSRDDFLKIVATHKGRSGDTPVELAAIHLRFDDGAGNPLSSAQANAIIDDVELWLDLNGDSIWQQGLDVTVNSAGTLTLDGLGDMNLTLPDGSAQAQIAFGTPRVYFVVVRTTANAGSQSPGAVRVTHVTSASSSGQDPLTDLPLVLEYAANLGTPSGGIPLPVSISNFSLD